MYCNRRRHESRDPPAQMSITQVVNTTNGLTSSITVAAKTDLTSVGTAIDPANGSVTACTTSDQPSSVTVSISSGQQGMSPQFQGTVTVSGATTVTADPTTWAGPTQPLTVTVTQDGTTTQVQIPDTQSPVTTPPPVPGAAPALVAYG